MQALDSYRPLDLDQEARADLNALMVGSFKALTRAATEKYGFPKIRKLRDSYKIDHSTLWMDPRARSFMDKMIAAEELMVRAHIKLAARICGNFDRFTTKERPGVTYDDYLQECATAIYNAQYMFNGSNKFSTYVRWAMYNGVVSFIREEETASGVGKKIKMLRNKTKHLMQSYCIPFEDAIARLLADEILTEDDTERLRDSMYLITRISPNEADLRVVDAKCGACDEMWSAVNKALLSPMQRRLVDAHLRGDRHFRRHLTENEINPSTGRLWTSQRLSSLFGEACLLIRSIYESQKRAA